MPLYSISGSNAYTLSLFSNKISGGPDTNSLASIGTLATPFDNRNSTNVVSFNFTGSSINLISGISYWLALKADGYNTLGTWQKSSYSVYQTLNSYFTTVYLAQNGSNYLYSGSGNPGAFGVSVSIVPEPCTYALLGLGAIGMLIVLRRKKTV